MDFFFPWCFKQDFVLQYKTLSCNDNGCVSSETVFKKFSFLMRIISTQWETLWTTFNISGLRWSTFLQDECACVSLLMWALTSQSRVGWEKNGRIRWLREMGL
jgi:hypothetical protein